MSSSTYLEDAAIAIIGAAESGRPLGPVFEEHCPEVARQILADRRYPEMLALWGRSCNIDENVGTAIVAPVILRLIGELAKVPMRGRFVHAGLAHTYGYLFSLIETPYGPKRQRWLSTVLEDGFGIEKSLLGDRPAEGTLLGNLTRFLVGIAFRGEAIRHEWPVAAEIAKFDFDRLQVSRIVESATTPRGKLQIVTDLVPFPNVPSQSGVETTLLVYSVRTGSRRRTRLITAFPMKSAAVEELKASVTAEKRVPIRLRYNAYVRGFIGQTFDGTRTLQESQ